METDLKCNRLTCRVPLADKAIVTNCSHIFCIDCANELFGTPQICPACESSLPEPGKYPTSPSSFYTNSALGMHSASNKRLQDCKFSFFLPDCAYPSKSVLSGLSPSIILEISSRAIAFWQYQIHQESSFQAAILKNLNERNAHLQKQLDNVVREANSELGLLNNKLTGTTRLSTNYSTDSTVLNRYRTRPRSRTSEMPGPCRIDAREG
ncbi:zinc-RING finger protein [Rhizoctonia solani 123E]|uniref:Zinc-RING finger protein n=1 Tax=Rhizoctonia solani 123E TaxID=1423351 RepID=A0A074T090_9AGAM|nr:zinc-RING finger protein [Rhizoctonia solani 123E]